MAMDYSKNTSLKDDIYKNHRRIKLRLNHLKKDPRISKKNKELIFKFYEEGITKGLSPSRIKTILDYTLKIGVMAEKDFDKFTIDDMKTLIRKVETKRKTDRKTKKETNQGLSEWTKENYKSVIKVFFKWLLGVNNGDPIPPIISWIETKDHPNLLTKEDLLTRDDIIKMMQSTPNIMFKALISTLFEGALRPGELLNMRIGDIHFKDNCIKVIVKGKMERKQGPRVVWLFNSYDILQNWLESHPGKDNKNNPVWINNLHIKTRGKVMQSVVLAHNIKRLSRKAKIEKPKGVWPYLFRHSRGTQLYKEIGETMAKKFMGHTPDSKMARTYLHLNDDDVLDSMEQQLGLKPKAEKKENGKCPRCNHISAFGSEICSRCGMPLTTNGVLQIEGSKEEREEEIQTLAEIKTLLKDPDVLELLRAMKEKKVEQLVES